MLKFVCYFTIYAVLVITLNYTSTSFHFISLIDVEYNMFLSFNPEHLMSSVF